MEVGKYLRRKVIDRELWWEKTQRTKYGGIWVQQKKVWPSKYLKRRAHKGHKLDFFLHKYPCDKSWSLWSVLGSVLTHVLLPEGMCLENIQVGGGNFLYHHWASNTTGISAIIGFVCLSSNLSNIHCSQTGLIVFGRGLLMAPYHFPFFPKPLNQFWSNLFTVQKLFVVCIAPIWGQKDRNERHY